MLADIFGGNFARIVTNPDRLRTITMLDRVATAELELEEKSAPPKTKSTQNEDSGPVSRAPPEARTSHASFDASVTVTGCSETFDWSSDEDIVIRQQREIAIYVNPHRQVVIRERGDLYDEDTVIIISAEHIPDVLEVLKATYDEII